MGYTDISVIWAGALDTAEAFSDEQGADMDALIASVKNEAGNTDESVQIYALYHDHDISTADCVCVQYLTDHSPLWDNEK